MFQNLIFRYYHKIDVKHVAFFLADFMRTCACVCVCVCVCMCEWGVWGGGGLLIVSSSLYFPFFASFFSLWKIKTLAGNFPDASCQLPHWSPATSRPTLYRECYRFKIRACSWTSQLAGLYAVIRNITLARQFVLIAQHSTKIITM